MSDRVVAVKLKCADILPSRLATRVTINCDPAAEIKLSALAPQACVRSEQQVKMVTLHSSNLDTPMSPLGLGRVKTLGGRRSELAEVSDARRFRGFGYARIAAKSGRMPMMFMTRVRL